MIARLAKALKTEADPTSNGGDAEDDVEMIESDVVKDDFQIEYHLDKSHKSKIPEIGRASCRERVLQVV